jgi:hypothetical protein
MSSWLTSVVDKAAGLLSHRNTRRGRRLHRVLLLDLPRGEQVPGRHVRRRMVAGRRLELLLQQRPAGLAVLHRLPGRLQELLQRMRPVLLGKLLELPAARGDRKL